MRGVAKGVVQVAAAHGVRGTAIKPERSLVRALRDHGALDHLVAVGAVPERDPVGLGVAQEALPHRVGGRLPEVEGRADACGGEGAPAEGVVVRTALEPHGRRQGIGRVEQGEGVRGRGGQVQGVLQGALGRRGAAVDLAIEPGDLQGMRALHADGGVLDHAAARYEDARPRDEAPAVPHADAAQTQVALLRPDAVVDRRIGADVEALDADTRRPDDEGGVRAARRHDLGPGGQVRPGQDADAAVVHGLRAQRDLRAVGPRLAEDDAGVVRERAGDGVVGGEEVAVVGRDARPDGVLLVAARGRGALRGLGGQAVGAEVRTAAAGLKLGAHALGGVARVDGGRSLRVLHEAARRPAPAGRERVEVLDAGARVVPERMRCDGMSILSCVGLPGREQLVGRPVPTARHDSDRTEESIIVGLEIRHASIVDVDRECMQHIVSFADALSGQLSAISSQSAAVSTIAVTATVSTAAAITAAATTVAATTSAATTTVRLLFKAASFAFRARGRFVYNNFAIHNISVM